MQPKTWHLAQSDKVSLPLLDHHSRLDRGVHVLHDLPVHFDAALLDLAPRIGLGRDELCLNKSIHHGPSLDSARDRLPTDPIFRHFLWSLMCLMNLRKVRLRRFGRFLPCERLHDVACELTFERHWIRTSRHLLSHGL